MVEKTSNRGLVILVVIVVIVGIAGGVFIYEYNHPKSVSQATVQIGDNVTVNYIGSFANTAQQGKVFDTSIYSVATNDLAYPKSLEYTPRGAPKNYTPLPVYVGPNAPAGGYSFGGLTFSGVVTGFWQGLVGLAGNATRVVTFPASQGYGPLNQSCLVTQPLAFTLPAQVLVPKSQFASLYPGVTPATGVQFADPTYGWNDYILSANSSTIVLQNSPYIGYTSSPRGWTMEVTNISGGSAGVITIQNELSVTESGLILGHAKSSVCGATQFIVSDVNLTAGTYVENFNKEVVGASLTFQVTIVGIWSPD
jgi:FKBP-type peptidyl-prolyl cis-trans isomerase 2